MDRANDEFSRNMDVVLADSQALSKDEQTFIKAWIVKLIDMKLEVERPIREEYSRALARSVNVLKKLVAPFNSLPPEGPLPPLADLADPWKQLIRKVASSQIESDRSVSKPPSEAQFGAPAPQPPGETPPRGEVSAQEVAGQEASAQEIAGQEASAQEVGGEGQQPKYTYKKMPCTRKATGAIPKTKKATRSPPPFDPYQYYNEYEDLEEIVKALARSKGQSFAEFVAAVSRHTRDFGQGLRSAMKAETSSFREYVDSVLSQRIKDLTEVLDEEQGRVIQGIKRDIEKWQIELYNVKKRIKEMVPTFDMDSYRKDKNYIKKLFAFNPAGISPDDDSFKRFSEESADRLKWIQEMTTNITCSNEQTIKDITEFKCKAMEVQQKEANKQQQLMASLNCEIHNYRQLKQERDHLLTENNELLSQLEEYNG